HPGASRHVHGHAHRCRVVRVDRAVHRHVTVRSQFRWYAHPGYAHDPVAHGLGNLRGDATVAPWPGPSAARGPSLAGYREAWPWSRKQESLSPSDAEGGQRVSLLVPLDTLRDDGGADGLSDGDQTLDQRVLDRAAMHATNQRHVDLEKVGLEP